MATRRTNPFAGFAQFARGYQTVGNRYPTGGNANYPAGTAPYQGWADFARGYRASHPSEFPGGAAPKAPGVAQPPPGPTPNPQPFDAQYENTVSGIARRTGDTLANLQYQQGQLGQTYGYQTDPQGNLSVDPSNPFSKAALLQRSYDQGQARTTNSNAAAGRLYAGSTQNALNSGTLGFQQGSDALKRAYQNAVQGIAQKRQQALTSQYIDTTGAQGDALQRALQNRPDPNTLPTGEPSAQDWANLTHNMAAQNPASKLKLSPGTTLAKGQTLKAGAIAYRNGRRGRLDARGGWHAL